MSLADVCNYMHPIPSDKGLYQIMFICRLNIAHQGGDASRMDFYRLINL